MGRGQSPEQPRMEEPGGAAREGAWWWDGQDVRAWGTGKGGWRGLPSLLRPPGALTPAQPPSVPLQCWYQDAQVAPWVWRRVQPSTRGPLSRLWVPLRPALRPQHHLHPPGRPPWCRSRCGAACPCLDAGRLDAPALLFLGLRRCNWSSCVSLVFLSDQRPLEWEGSPLSALGPLSCSWCLAPTRSFRLCPLLRHC